MTPPLLHIHPETRVFRPELIPVGLVGLLNALRENVTAKLFDEVTDEQIRRVSIVSMDLHWFYQLGSFRALSSRIRKLNPNAAIIAGGYSASIFAPTILKQGLADYLVLGDADEPFPALVDALLDNNDPLDVPNVVARDQFEPRSRWAVTPEAFDAMNNTDFSVFPTVERLTEFVQRRAGFSGLVYPYSNPFIPVFRGCRFECDYCMGSQSHQRSFARRGLVARSPERVREDIESYVSRRFSHVNIENDFLTVLSEDYANAVLFEPLPIAVCYGTWGVPEPERMKLLLDSFSGGLVDLSDDRAIATGEPVPDLERLAELLKLFAEYPNYQLTVHVVRNSPAPNGQEKTDRLITLQRSHRFFLAANDFWWGKTPVPQNGDYLSETESARFEAEGMRMGLFYRLLKLHRMLVPWIPAFVTRSLRRALTALTVRQLKKDAPAAQN
jgi:pyruvate-formate lyase-activating enzyme